MTLRAMRDIYSDATDDIPHNLGRAAVLPGLYLIRSNTRPLWAARKVCGILPGQQNEDNVKSCY